MSKKSKIVEILYNNDYQLTAQREYIIDLFLETNKHLTIKNIYEELDNPDIGQATIYRSIKILLKLDIIRRFNIDNINYYEISLTKKHNHHHLVCSKCDEIIELHFDELDELERKIEKLYGFEVQNHTLKLCGICKKCLNKGDV